MNKRYVSIKDAQEILPLSRPTIARLIKDGELRAKNTGKKWLIDLDSIHAYMEGDEARTDAMVARILN
jgi:excisionase family DNA binding protein